MINKEKKAVQSSCETCLNFEYDEEYEGEYAEETSEEQ